MLAKLKYLRQEDKALQEIETKLRAQLNRLKQEERVLRRQMRQPDGGGLAIDSEHTSDEIEKDREPSHNVDDDEVINKEPLMDLETASSILQMCQAQYVEERLDTEEEEEEEEDEDDDGDKQDRVGSGALHGEDELTAEYQNLLREMRGDDNMEEEYDDDDGT